MNIEKTLELVSKNIRQMGFDVDTYISGSMAASSGYVTFRPTENSDEIKIRISDHELPATYKRNNGVADYEIGPHGSGNDEWFVVVDKIATRLNVATPATVKSLITKNKKNQEEDLSTPSVFMEKKSTVDQIMIERGYAHLTGQARKRKREKIRKELKKVYK